MKTQIFSNGQYILFSEHGHIKILSPNIKNDCNNIGLANQCRMFAEEIGIDYEQTYFAQLNKDYFQKEIPTSEDYKKFAQRILSKIQ